MVKFYRCYVCGEQMMGDEKCTYCGKYVCEKHRTNGLCPMHANAVSEEDAKSLVKLSTLNSWTFKILILPILICGGLSLPLMFRPQNFLYGVGLLGLALFLACILAIVVVYTKSQSKSIYNKIKESEGNHQQTY